MGVLSYRPNPSEFTWTFGGVPPVRRVAPGDILELWTEDAFGGKVRGPDDHITRVIEFPFVNPQTGPYQLLTQVIEWPVANVVDPNYTFLAEVPKAYLPRVDAYGGVHARLRGVAARYRG
jgi:acetamidase/formamidase